MYVYMYKSIYISKNPPSVSYLQFVKALYSWGEAQFVHIDSEWRLPVLKINKYNFIRILRLCTFNKTKQKNG